MSSARLHAAIDLGASSARLIAGRLEDGCLVTSVVARHPNVPVQLPDGLHWDVLGLFQAIIEALADLARHSGSVPMSVGIDGWGVDFGLLDASGHLLGNPFHYRDQRTAGRIEQLDRLIGRERIYEATGIQEMPINTVCQLLAERESAAYGAATELLMVPDLFGYLLTGKSRLERTNASTTQLVDARTGEFVGWMLDALGLRKELFAPWIEPGEELGSVLAEVAHSVGMKVHPEVVAVASHDTASAVLAVPASGDDFAYVVSGTWSLVGLELDAPVIDEASRRANFSNELGVDGTVRFLKNVMGHWMLQECERSWAQEGRTVRVVDLLDEASRCPPFRSLVDTGDPAFADPGDMPERVRAACVRTGEPVPESDAALVRCLFDSMALAISDAISEAQRCARREVQSVHVVGGGAANAFLLSLVAATTGLEAAAGPVEASAIGNLLVQLRATGQMGGRAEMRALVSKSFPVTRCEPDPALVNAATSARLRLQEVSAARRERVRA